MYLNKFILQILVNTKSHNYKYNYKLQNNKDIYNKEYKTRQSILTIVVCYTDKTTHKITHRIYIKPQATISKRLLHHKDQYICVTTNNYVQKFQLNQSAHFWEICIDFNGWCSFAQWKVHLS